MSGRANQLDQMDAITKVIEIVPHSAAIKAHIQQVIESPAFKGSRRSQQFLLFVVDNALAGHFEELKERTLGTKLFGREPAYNTADDAIVRVTACDVRKRLTHFYSDIGPLSEFRIELPLGSYIPEFQRTSPVLQEANDLVPPMLAVEQTEIRADPVAAPPPPSPTADPTKQVGPGRVFRPRVVYSLAALALCLGLWFWLRNTGGSNAKSPEHLLPWSAVIPQNRHTHVVFCDPEIVSIQRLSGRTLSLSDYANQHYWPNPDSMKPEQRWIADSGTFRGVNVTAVDVAILLQIAGLGFRRPLHDIETHTARGVRLADFKTEDSFILLGSPRSNPWVQLFQNQLDLVFEFDESRKAEFIRNKRPLSGESPQYVPTAAGWDTGQAYGIIALVGNPNQSGQVMIVAGSNAEATEAAGKLATNVKLLSQTLKNHGIDPAGPVRHFEILLQVSTMAGSSNTFDVIAFHLLTDKPREE
jgi:hypothetical protein